MGNYKCKTVALPDGTVLSRDQGYAIECPDYWDLRTWQKVQVTGQVPLFELSYWDSQPLCPEKHPCSSVGELLHLLCVAQDAGHTTVSQDDPRERLLGFADVNTRSWYTISLNLIRSDSSCWFGCKGDGCDCGQTPPPRSREEVLSRLSDIHNVPLSQYTLSQLTGWFTCNYKGQISPVLRDVVAAAREQMQDGLLQRLNDLVEDPSINQVTLVIRTPVVCLHADSCGYTGYSIFCNIGLLGETVENPEGEDTFAFQRELPEIPERAPGVLDTTWISTQIGQALGVFEWGKA